MKATALDLASRTTGIAWGVAGEKPSAATWRLGPDRKTTRGARGLALMRFLVAHLDEFRPDEVFIEAPQPPAVLVEISGSPDTAIMLPGLVFLAETVCESRGISYHTLDRQKVLKHFTGRASYREKIDGKDAAKKACIARATQLGWTVDGYDQGDALALLDYGMAITNPRMAHMYGADAQLL